MSKRAGRLRLAVLTVSTAATVGDAEDAAGRRLIEMAEERGWHVVAYHVCPNDPECVHASLTEMADVDEADVVFTVGGIGLGPDDITPEATGSVCARRLPGPAEAIRAAGIKADPAGMFSRGDSAMRGSTAVVNLPDDDAGLRRSFEVVAEGLERLIDLRSGDGGADARG